MVNHRIRNVGLLAGVVVLGGACGERAADDVGDVAAIELVALPRIGGDGEDPEHAFGSVADIEIGDDGEVLVLDGMNRRVLVFDADGALLRTFGGRGRGPGELERPTHLVWRPGGELWVVDTGNGRYTAYDADGAVAGTYRHADPGAVFHPWAVGFSDEGLLYVVTSGPDLMEQALALVELEVGDGAVREGRRFELPFIEPPTGFHHMGEGMILMLQVPFSSEPLLAIGTDGELWHAATREPWVHRRDFPDGDVRRYGRDFEAPRVTRAERDAVLEQDRGVEELRTAAGPGVFAEFTRLIPETKPHLDAFFVDDEGRVWILRATRAGMAARDIDVYAPDGALVATARAALDAEPRPRGRGGLIVGVVRDELGVASVARYRSRP